MLKKSEHELFQPVSIVIIKSNMSDNIEIIRSVKEIRERISSWRNNNLRVGLVPTMGALHEGHLSLVDQSKGLTDRTIASLFVNPRQFLPDEDFEMYPRDEFLDVQLLSARGVDVLFSPSVDEMYPNGFVTTVSVPGIGDILEGEFRPQFFNGVATVVSKLLIQMLPDFAFFGEKDFQQLCVIRRLVLDLGLPVEIVGCPIIREASGLALSSRNAYLSKHELDCAPALFKGLESISKSILNGMPISESINAAKGILYKEGFDKVDYLVVCEAETLTEVEYFRSPARILGAAWIGKTRLIDNLRVADSN